MGFNSAHSSEEGTWSALALWFVRSTERFYLPLPRSEPCRMAEWRTWIGDHRDRRGHLLATHGGGYRMRHAQHRTVPTTRKKTMNVIWQWPKPKSRRAIGSRPRTTTSTPNIISDWCPRMEERNRSPGYKGKPNRSLGQKPCLAGALVPEAETLDEVWWSGR